MRIVLAPLLLAFSEALLWGTIVATPQVSPVSPQPVGTPVLITFGATDTGPGPINYRLEVSPPGSTYQIVHDFNMVPSFSWAQNLAEGTYQLRVTARDNGSGESSQTVISYVITSRVTGTQSVVSPTNHPLVALFSAPACPVGGTMQIAFNQNNTANLFLTSSKPCGSGSMNFLVAGLYPKTVYDMNWLVTNNGVTTKGKGIQFTAGTLPASFNLANLTIPVPSTSATSAKEKILLSGFADATVPYATDLYGNVLWFYNGPSTFVQLQRLLPGGTLMICVGLQNAWTGSGVWGNQSKYQVLRETDLAGNVVRETNVDRINEQLPSGEPSITTFNHDAVRLPNGHTLALASTQHIYPANTQGNAKPIAILGNTILDLDTNFQLTWYWNSFEHASGGGQLDLSRPAVLGETCRYNANHSTGLGCPPVLLTNPANDWLHGNSLQYEPDGSILLSLRHQDWVVDIDYGNGTGTGNVLWRLGPDGDFSMQTGGQYPWFSHQHDPEFVLGAMTSFTVFDNGNTRIATYGGDSRGLVLNVDIPDRTANVAYSVDTGVNSVALGSAQLLSNGDYMFLAGDDLTTNAPNETSWSNEYSPSGTVTYSVEAVSSSYRSFRVPDLYTPPNGAGTNVSQ